MIGNVGKDGIKITDLDNGNVVANLSLATNENWKDAEGKPKQATDWHSVKLWGDLEREAAEQFRQGDFVRIAGKLKTDSFEDKKGNKRYTTYVLGFSIKEVKAKEDTAETKPETKKSRSKKAA